jgi:hypothetical protein
MVGFLRMNKVTPIDSYSLDDSKGINELADLGNHAALENETLTQVKSRFPWGCSNPMET